MRVFDAILTGSGQGGKSAVSISADIEWKVAMIEQNPLTAPASVLDARRPRPCSPPRRWSIMSAESPNGTFTSLVCGYRSKAGRSFSSGEP